MYKRYEIIRKAMHEVGYKEGRNNDNKYGKWYGLNNAAWCVIFVQWVYNNIMQLYRTASTSDLNKHYFHNATNKPQTGDIVILKGHTELFIRDADGGHHYYSVGGNVGDSVKISRRAYNDTISFISVINQPYNGPLINKTIYKGSRGEEVKKLQQFLNEVTGAGLAIDGSYGPLTTAAVKDFQKVHNITVGGDIGYNTLKVIKSYSY